MEPMRLTSEPRVSDPAGAGPYPGVYPAVLEMHSGCTRAYSAVLGLILTALRLN